MCVYCLDEQAERLKGEYSNLEGTSWAGTKDTKDVLHIINQSPRML